MTTNIIPYQDRVLIRRTESENQTKGGIYIPDSAKEKPSKGIVIAVGSGSTSQETGIKIPLDIKINDVVLFEKYGGTEIDENGEKLLMLKSSHIIAVIK